MCFIMEVSIPIGISLPINIVKRLDSERGDISRSRYLLRMIENMYAGKEDKEKYFDITEKDNQDSLDRRFGSLQSSEARST